MERKIVFTLPDKSNMIVEKDLPPVDLKVSSMAETLIGSEIIRIAGEVNDKIKKGIKIYNLTIGDFDPSVFPIPSELKDEIIKAYQANHTNYPAANGIPELRREVSSFIGEQQSLTYSSDEILIACGARPLIYATYITILDKGEKVVFPVPSWNNNHYCHLSGVEPIFVETTADNNFMPVAADLAPHLSEAALVALCSPLNPTGTVFTEQGLAEICDLILAENTKRQGNRKPLYLMYDQIYSALCFAGAKHFDPVTLRPEMRPYTIYIDGISKSLAATGVRVGWAFGPMRIIEKMKAILSHVGAWAPKAEQVATAKYLSQKENVRVFQQSFGQSVEKRLQGFYNGFSSLKNKGYNVEAVSPQAAIYLTVKIDLAGMKTADGKILSAQKDVTDYILNEAHMALVPFFAFGSSENSPWYRLSVGACKESEIPEVMGLLEAALKKLS